VCVCGVCVGRVWCVCVVCVWCVCVCGACVCVCGACVCMWCVCVLCVCVCVNCKKWLLSEEIIWSLAQKRKKNLFFFVTRNTLKYGNFTHVDKSESLHK